MNDRFKFRIWNNANQIMSYEICFGNFFKKSKTEKEVFDWISVSFGDDGFITYRDIGTEYNVFDNLKIMQCTGLKDKNGTLIYEGDIVKNRDNREYEIIWCYEAACFLVQNVTTKCKQGIYSLVSLSNDLEVIGNIYENKELLESEDK